jgi:multiple sugar transport system substrate-binding protein
MKSPTGRGGARSQRRTRVLAVGAVVGLAGGLAACSSGPEGTVVNLYGGASAAGFDKIIAACNKEAAGRYTIVGNLLPSDADGQREQFVRRLAAQDTGMDLLGMDVTWTAEFAEAGWVRELTGEKATAATEGTLEKPVETAKWKDKLYGIPKHTNVQLLWYRKSLVPEAPSTWDQLMQMSQKLKDEGKTYQIAFTAAQYEGYVVNVNNMLAAHGATFVNEDSTKATLDEKAVQGLTLLNKLATSGLTSASLSNAQEPEVFADLQAGRAAFALNWPYVLSAMRTAGESDPKSKEVADDLGYAPFPTVKEGDDPKVTLGGMNYAISTYSEHPEETYEAAMCLRKPEHQLQTALEAGDPPVLESVFDEPEFQKNYPMYEAMLKELESAVPRPVTPIYQNISTLVSTNLSPPSAIDPEQSTAELNDLIQEAIEGKGILP